MRRVELMGASRGSWTHLPGSFNAPRAVCILSETLSLPTTCGQGAAPTKGRIWGKKVAWQDYALWKGYPLDLLWLLRSSLYIQKQNYKLPRALRMIRCSPEWL